MKRQFTNKEYEELKVYLKDCGRELKGAKLYWDDECELGEFNDEFDSIDVMDKPLVLRKLVPNIIHELTHREQRRYLDRLFGNPVVGWLVYNVLGFRLWAKLTIEPEAIKREKRAEEVMNFQYGTEDKT